MYLGGVVHSLYSIGYIVGDAIHPVYTRLKDVYFRMIDVHLSFKKFILSLSHHILHLQAIQSYSTMPRLQYLMSSI